MKLSNGSTVNCFDNGTIQVQGKKHVKESVESMLGDLIDAGTGAVSAAPKSRKIFVVYGHDPDARKQLENLLRKWELDPIVLEDLPTEGATTIIEKLEKHAKEASYAIVLATPDDQGHKAGHENEKKYRARQNVVLELGMMFSHLGRKRVAIIEKQGVDFERPSDIAGVVYIPFKESIDDAQLLLFKNLNAAGIRIDPSRL